MTSTEYTIDGKTLSYEIFDNGYDIYVDGNLSYTQRKPYIPYPNLSYQENAIRQIMRIAGVEEPSPEPTQLDRIEAAINQKNNDIAMAAIDAYTMELLEGGLLS